MLVFCGHGPAGNLTMIQNLWDFSVRSQCLIWTSSFISYDSFLLFSRHSRQEYPKELIFKDSTSVTFVYSLCKRAQSRSIYIRWRASWLLLKAVILLLRLHLPGFCCRSAVLLWKVCDIGHGDTWLYWESSTSHFTHKYMSNVISWFDIIVSCGILYKILNSLLMKLLNGMEKIPTPIKKNNPQFILFIAIIRL